ncbi:unnamed protein product [Pleuronectes platessa]|uniref:Uncharacterized protein n=1 Tax=Pleuronectes platessa TaxID=8262 RepID=A0A9N7U6F3_PLEPL|nr:unnamed protein product [Pleuronectes platessa]
MTQLSANTTSSARSGPLITAGLNVASEGAGAVSCITARLKQSALRKLGREGRATSCHQDALHRLSKQFLSEEDGCCLSRHFLLDGHLPRRPFICSTDEDTDGFRAAEG